MAGENSRKFDLQVVHDKFLESLHDEDDVKLQLYLDSFGELNKFFLLMGTVFGFVSQDLQAKMDIIAEFLCNDQVSHHFETVRKMMDYESKNNLLYKNGYTSGSRTLLRLHRGLDFIREFLKSIGELDDDGRTSTVCRQVYDRTLAKHHSFVIKNGAKLAMYTLPPRKHLLKNVCGNDEEIQRALEILPKTLKATDAVYTRIESLYTVYNLHTLP